MTKQAISYLRVSTAEQGKSGAGIEAQRKHKTERQYLHMHEIKRMIDAAAKLGRNGKRDALIIDLIARHGLRESELTALRWADFDFDAPGGATLLVHRLKGSADSVHSLEPAESKQMRAWRKQCVPGASLVFYSEQGGEMSAQVVQRLVARASEAAGLGWIHPHLLRHSTGFHLAEQGWETLAIAAYLGHRNIQNAVIYTKMSPARLAKMRVRL